MKQFSFILLITILTQTSCENSTSTNKEVETSDPKKIDSTIVLEAELIVDSIDLDTTHIVKEGPKQKDTTLEKKKIQTDDNAINIEDALDVNKYRNVRDDPDYIGTPCKIVEGKCVRHNHKNEEELPKDLLDK